jgi:hypothetical protein
VTESFRRSGQRRGAFDIERSECGPEPVTGHAGHAGQLGEPLDVLLPASPVVEVATSER